MRDFLEGASTGGRLSAHLVRIEPGQLWAWREGHHMGAGEIVPS